MKILKILILLTFFISPVKAEFDIKAKKVILQDFLSGEILYEKNTTVDVGKVIARIGEVGEKIDSQPKSSEKEDNKKEKKTVTSSEPKIVLEEPEEKVKKVQKQTSNKFYSPLVKSIAKTEGISFEELDIIINE